MPTKRSGKRKRAAGPVHASNLRKPATTLRDVVDDWTGKCRFNAKWLAEQDEVTVTSSKITNEITGDEYSMQIEHCVELWFGAQLLNECTAATTDDVAHIRTMSPRLLSLQVSSHELPRVLL